MLPPITPEDADIVLRQERREGAIVYLLRAAPGTDQYLVRGLDEAIAQAVTFAKREHVRAWLSNNVDFELLEDFRMVPDRGVTMAKTKADERTAAASDRPRKPLAPQASVDAGDVARRAYDLYLARGREHGHDVDDWMQAERELREGSDIP